MRVLKEVLDELWSMFVGDRRLTFLVLLVVAVAATCAVAFNAHLLAAALLLVGALAVLADSVWQAARRHRNQ